MVLVQIWPFFQLFCFRQYSPGKCLLRYSSTKTPFQNIKTRTSESRKIKIFSKGFVQKWPFVLIFFQAIQAMKMSFTILQNKKQPFQAIKTTSSKSRKIDIFETHGFGPKMAIFPSFFYMQYGQGKCLLRNFRTKKRLSTL